MGQAKRRGTFEERKAIAIAHQKDVKAKQDTEDDKHYDSERPYRNFPQELSLYIAMSALSGGLKKPW